MYLKSLELQGFKSFPDKTKLTFESGATVIVGPNGSGKSNISDAMRWVLGEVSSKSIRGTKMEDIIFGGADNRRPMGYAEVSVTFDNTSEIGKLDCPYDEVTVTRRYYRAGESEYYINRRAVRLRDIYEMFMNTGIGRDGYSIIGQGKIAEIISRKSDERRSIFEDASGIAKYRHKKSETEKKLADTQDNMTRINDVFTEVAAQIGPLEKEAEKAKKALELLETKKKVDVQLWLYDTEKLREDIARAEENYKHAGFDLQTAEDAIKAYEVQNEKLFEASQSNKQDAERLFGEIREQTEKNHTLDSEYRVNETTILHTAEMKAQAQGAAASAQKSIDNEDRSQQERDAKIGELNAKLDSQKKEYDEAVKISREEGERAEKLGFEIAHALDDIRTLQSEDVDIKARISVIENARLSDTDKHTAVQNQISEYEKLSQSLTSQSESIKKTVDEYASAISETENSINGISAQLADLYLKRHNDNEALTAKKLRRDSVSQRIDTFKAMEEQFEGYAGSVRFVMKRYAENKITDRFGNPCGRIYGPLSRIISVEDKYVTAIETALGANLQHIVVEDESVAKAAMFALKKAEAGRATFFPLTSMKGQSVTDEMRDASGFEGYIAVASELVTADRKFSPVISGLLGRTVIFDNIENASVMAKSLRFRVRAVTLDGQQINVGGSFTGGSVKQNGNILGRAGEIKRLESELAELDAAIGKDSKAMDSLISEIENAEDEKQSSEEKKKLLTVMQNSENARLEQITAKLEANNTLIEKLRSDYEVLIKTYERYDEDIRAFETRGRELKTQIEEISAVRAEKDILRNAAAEKKADADARVTELYIALSETQKDIDTEKSLILSSEGRIEEFIAQLDIQNAKIKELDEKLKELENLQKENRRLYGEGEKKLAVLNAEHSKIEAGGYEFERKLNEVNAKMREKMSQKELVFREYTKCENKLENLRGEQDKLSSKLWDEHEMTRSDALALGYPALDASTRPEAAAKQTECRNKLRVIGNVDLDAVNKYKDVKARYDYMEGQIRDLNASRDDLLDIIGRLEGEMKTSFVDSFNKINENFNKVFAELFGGGSAELSLTDPDNVLESGIEIKAAPPGKIIKNLVQLSGGEQAFIAIALFFAILQVNPTPFCILDEIEAALDEVNVARFSEYIKRYSPDTQFILITHRRGTMEAANRLYGVTMPERGISKVLELDINEISKKKGDDWDGIFG